jgi:hypothetical protein
VHQLLRTVGACGVVRAGMVACTLYVNAYFHRCEPGRKLGSVLSECFIWITVQPAFAWLSGSDHRMRSGVRVFAGVLIWRAVAAERGSARLARP